MLSTMGDVTNSEWGGGGGGGGIVTVACLDKQAQCAWRGNTSVQV